MSIIGDGLEILSLIDKAKNADVYRQLGDYIDKIREQQIENDRLHEQVRDLREQLRFRGTVERVHGHVFVQGDDDEICPRCAEVDMRPIHFVSQFTKDNGLHAGCPQCKLQTHFRYPCKRENAMKGE
jgi:hypothetical protein